MTTNQKIKSTKTNPHKTDAQIAQETIIQPIIDIAQKIGLTVDDIDQYGKYKAKINSLNLAHLPNKQGHIILVTAINPTPAGEGKTTVTIGLADALNHLQTQTNKQAMSVIREPSLGPVFGIKGGAAGGGYAQVLPMQDINLHFTGDFHAIGAANNLLAALIDNHIYQGNALNIDPKRVLWRRVVDMNDRQLRHITSGQGKSSDGTPRSDGFDITVASEVMACFCLAKDLMDLKDRLGNILVAYSTDNKAIFAKDLQAQGAMTALLKEAINPNLVQTIEGTPTLIHGGPFANIAHGCNSLIATNMACQLADFVVTEAGFGADLGAEKFIDIKCRLGGIVPSVCVIVATARALKYNGGVDKNDLQAPNVQAIQDGLPNLLKHIDNMQSVFGLPVVVALNRFLSDTQDELDTIVQACQHKGAKVALCEVWAKGGVGGIDLAQQVIQAIDERGDHTVQFAYDLNLPIKQKIKTLAQKIYGASDVDFLASADSDLVALAQSGIDIDSLPICMAKTQYSFSDNAKLLGVVHDFRLTVRNLTLSNGAGFVVVVCGNIMKMPGLPKVPSAVHIDVEPSGNIVGLF